MEIFVALLLLAIIAAIVVYVMRQMKGSLDIEFREVPMRPGVHVRGKVHLLCKKPVQGHHLKVALVAVEETRWREDGEERCETEQIYRDELRLEGRKRYPAGFQHSWNFDFVVPDIETPELSNSPLARAVLQALGNRERHTLKWRLESRLDAEGLDLVAHRGLSSPIFFRS